MALKERPPARGPGVGLTACSGQNNRRSPIPAAPKCPASGPMASPSRHSGAHEAVRAPAAPASNRPPTASPDAGLRNIGGWIVIGLDAVGKRAAARCAGCGAIRELSLQALEWGEVTPYMPVSGDARSDLHDAVIDYAWVNPHATLSFATPDRSFTHEATDPDWTKWKPTDPTSPHWYDVGSLKTLMAAEINKARRSNADQKTVAEFVSDFRGLSSTIKRRDICEAVSASREPLDAFFARGDDAIRRLLDQMKAASKPVRARDLGVIGENHVLDMIASESGQYKLAEIDDGGVPYLIEAGFGHRPGRDSRTFSTGLNWSLSIGGNPFRDLGWGRSLGSVLESQHAGPEEPVAFFLHLASPCLKFRDMGKTSVSLPGKVIDAIIAVVKQVTKTWYRQRKAEERNADAKLRREDALKKAAKTTIKEAAYSVMAKAYAKASDNGTLPAEPRQIYYAARDDIMSRAQVSAVNADTFTQQLLIGYTHDHPKDCAGWDIAFSDRGHFEEPHTGHVVGLGTLAVREYRGATPSRT